MIPTAESLVDASWFFSSYVLPNYREFLEDQLSARRAFNAAISIAHVPDHIVWRGGGKKGEIGNVQKDFRARSVPFRQTEAMCNAFKHVYATGGGSSVPVITTTSVSIANAQEVLFVSPLNGQVVPHHPVRDILICEYRTADSSQKLWVGWTLCAAMRFLADEIGCAQFLTPYDVPDQVNLVARRTFA